MKKKGFTLVELLAVIVILAVIGLISVPMILNNIEKSRVSTYRSNTQMLIEASKQYVSKKMEDNDYPQSGINIKDLSFKKGNFKSGIIKRCNEEDVKAGNCTSEEVGEIIAVNIYNGKYCAKGTKQAIEVLKVETEKDCENIDSTSPELTLKVIKATNNSVLIAAYGYDSQSKITKYAFKIGDGEEKVKETESRVATYEFTNLKANQEYEITVSVENENKDNYNETTYKTTKSITVSTLETNIPTFKVSGSGYSSSKEVTITYPKIEGGENYYDITYDGGKTWTTTKANENTTKVVFTKNGKIRAYTKYPGNVVENTLNVIGIDEGGPTITKITNSDKWEASKEIVVEAVDTGIGLDDKAYSFDGGKTWTSKNTKSFKKNQLVYFVVRDKMGNKTTDIIVINKIDTVNPTCELIVKSGTVGTNGWYKSNVEMAFGKTNDEALDSDGKTIIPGSGVKETKLSESKVVKDGTYTVTGTVIDKVGNKGTCQLTVKKDATPPVPTLSISGTAYGSGYKSGAVVSTSCQEKTSGIAAKTGNQTLTTVGNNNVTGTCVDNAGNSASKTSNYIIYVYTKDSKCGYASCPNASCGCQTYNTCQTAACGETKYCSKYNTCQTAACGETTYCSQYNTCQTAACGETTYCTQYSCTLYKSCKLSYNISRKKYSEAQCIAGFSGRAYKCDSDLDGNRTPAYCNTCTQNTASRQEGCGTETAYGSACDNAQSRTCSNYSKKTNSCANEACGCAQYSKKTNSCENEACGCAQYSKKTNSCANAACGCQTYKSCPNASCGYTTCWHA